MDNYARRRSLEWALGCLELQSGCWLLGSSLPGGVET